MTDRMRWLLRRVCEGDLIKAQQEARTLLTYNKVKKDEAFCQSMLHTLDKSQTKLIELPPNLQGLLVAEDTSSFPFSRFISRPEEERIVAQMVSTARASGKLAELGISCNPTLMLYGISGGGKTMLARYIAHKLEKPFVYVRFSNVVSSHLGSTQSNIARIFDFVRKSSCVLCFDEIDAVGMARGQRNDVGEMNRIVITLMQEMDNLQNDTVIIGTTNRHDHLDDALLRRFQLQHEVMPLNDIEALELSSKFFASAGYEAESWVKEWGCDSFGDVATTPAEVVRKCTDKIIANYLIEEENVK